MLLVIDSNVLLAAIIKSAVTRDLMLDSRLSLVSPEHLLSETLKHIKEDNEIILKLSRLSEAEIDELFSYLTQRITIKPEESYDSFIEEAIKIVPHDKDAPFMALALSLNCPLWSNDKRLSKQPKVKVFSTEELIKFLHFP